MVPAVTRDKVTKARQALSKVIQAQEWLEIAKACGLECSEEDSRCQEMKGFLEKYLEIFGNQYPTPRS